MPCAFNEFPGLSGPSARTWSGEFGALRRHAGGLAISEAGLLELCSIGAQVSQCDVDVGEHEAAAVVALGAVDPIECPGEQLKHGGGGLFGRLGGDRAGQGEASGAEFASGRVERDVVSVKVAGCFHAHGVAFSSALGNQPGTGLFVARPVRDLLPFGPQSNSVRLGPGRSAGGNGKSVHLGR